MSKRRFPVILFLSRVLLPVLLLLPLCLSAIPAGALTEGDYDYSLINGGEEVEITRYRGTDAKVTVPDRIDGKPVTSIGGSAFFNCGAEEIVLPDGCLSLGYMVFRDCYSLRKIDLGNGVETIPGYAFYSCSSLKEVIFGASVKTIASFAFNNCPALEEIVLPDSLKSIEERPFSACASLTTVDLGNGLETIPQLVCDNCPSLKKIVLGTSVKTIASKAFQYCAALEEIVLPDSLTSIGQEAFRGCASLKNVYLGNGLRSIPANAFSDCPALENVFFGASVKTVERFAFYCSALKTAWFCGDRPEIGKDNGALTSADWKISPSSEGFGADARIVSASSLTYDAGGGSFVSPLTGEEVDSYSVLSFGGRFPAPVVPSREGYFFAGWRLEGSDRADDFDFSISGSFREARFTAAWQKEEAKEYPPRIQLSDAFFSSPGEEVALTLSSFREPTGFSGCNVGIRWDVSALEFVSVQFAPLRKNTSSSGETGKGELSVSFGGTLNLAGSSKTDAAVLKFRVLPGAKAENPVSLSVDRYAVVFTDSSAGVPAKNGKVRSAEKVALSQSAFGAAIGEKPSLNGVPVFDRALEIYDKAMTVSSLASLLRLPEGTKIRIVSPPGTETGPFDPPGTGITIELLRGEKTVDALPCLVKGDGDGNGECDVFDAVALLSWIVNGEANPLRAAARCALNVDGSDAVDVFDAVSILTFIVRGGWE